jgi:general stress protein YciG
MMVSSMVKRVKMPENVLRFFREAGSEGGKARAEKHTKEELREWGKKGGRPRGSGKRQKGKK